jgi:hypothetical protein
VLSFSLLIRPDRISHKISPYVHSHAYMQPFMLHKPLGQVSLTSSYGSSLLYKVNTSRERGTHTHIIIYSLYTYECISVFSTFAKVWQVIQNRSKFQKQKPSAYIAHRVIFFGKLPKLRVFESEFWVWLSQLVVGVESWIKRHLNFFF